MLHQDTPDSTQLRRSKAKVARQRHGLQPELGGEGVAIHVDVRYLLWNMTEADGAAHLVEEMGVR